MSKSSAGREFILLAFRGKKMRELQNCKLRLYSNSNHQARHTEHITHSITSPTLCTYKLGYDAKKSREQTTNDTKNG
jgi:hypothetical protein